MRLFIGSFATIHNYQKLKEDFSFLNGNWVKAKNIHLTYLFLGNVKVVDAIKYKLSKLTYEEKEIKIKGLGFFGSPPKVLYAKTKDSELYSIHNQIVNLLNIKDNKNFIPHITLCRIKAINNYQKFIKKVKEYEDIDIGTLKIKVELIKSTLTPKGPIYKSIKSF